MIIGGYITMMLKRYMYYLDNILAIRKVIIMMKLDNHKT